MKAMILAAGRGERMMPLTARCPKPLLSVAGKPLIEYHIKKIALAGIKQIVINVSYLGQQIQRWLGDGDQFGVSITYSLEHSPLETGGGIKKILPIMAGEPFLVVNADIWSDMDYKALVSMAFDTDNMSAHLMMVPNPCHHPEGDFGLADDNLLLSTAAHTFTYSGVGLFSEKLFVNSVCQQDRFPLLPLFQHGITNKQITGQVFDGFWCDVGTPQRLQQLEQHLQAE